MKWREFFTVEKETDTYAVVTDPAGGPNDCPPRRTGRGNHGWR